MSETLLLLYLFFHLLLSNTYSISGLSDELQQAGSYRASQSCQYPLGRTALRLQTQRLALVSHRTRTPP
ncbi:hypothetical protein CesoFtcFv8_000148 [Champsocephalus esox]|uniref:Secreted protein n=1 Tax=Champsocephalus esox TaxID=159716 RepID=A0AAN8E7A2_9TELE|nr:hypothetical protein CesoFtcFv8_000148 [Champsocephalus esox]